MLFLKNLPEIENYIDKINNCLKYSGYSKKGLTKIQKAWISFCLTALVVTSSFCWEEFQRSSAGKWKAKALSWMMKHSNIPWEKLLIASIKIILKSFGIVNGELVLDDMNRERSKRTKKIYGVHKSRIKGGGFGNVQNLVVLLLVNNKISIPVGFYFYRPDPKRKAWKIEDEKLRKKGIPKKFRPPIPDYDNEYPPKKDIAIKLLRQFKYHFSFIKIKSITADSAYLSSKIRINCARIYPETALISQLRRNLKVRTKRGKEVSLDHYFSWFHLKKAKITLRDNLNKVIYFTSARVYIRSLGRKMNIVGMLYEGESKLRYICCSDLTWRAEDIIQKYSFRWLIEVFFQDWKVYNGWGKLACQYHYEGACRGVILSLLLDHFLIQHPIQRRLSQTDQQLITVGTLKKKLQFESLFQSIEEILKDKDPQKKFRLVKKSIESFIKLRPSDKHMSGKEMFEREVSPSLYARYKNAS